MIEMLAHIACALLWRGLMFSETILWTLFPTWSLQLILQLLWHGIISQNNGLKRWQCAKCPLLLCDSVVNSTADHGQPPTVPSSLV